MNKIILSVTLGVVFFLALAHSNANVCTIFENNLNGYRKPSQELVTISNDTDQCKFTPLNNYYIRDTYRTRNLNIRSESRKVRVDGKEQERRLWLRVDDTRKVRLTRSTSLPNIRREHVRNARERDIDFRGIERNDKRFLKYRSDERTFRREVRDGRYERQTSRDNINARRTTNNRENDMVAVNDKETSTEWPFSNFVQSAIGVLGLYYFGKHNKNTK
ncbi:Hypothetical protein CINCED_3A002214 [Cinara cedri]|uniref:Uncharacterized protein n=1 Tax=Cinara cedri TaxID=506608 RepID=A0A5E4MXG8_9HEMI|nr:Hypothetical protein CINCED_3A002214 [Cinara cedri]